MRLTKKLSVLLKILNLFSAVCVAGLVSGCGANQYKALEQSTQKASSALGCSSFKSKVFDSMYDYLDTEKMAPNLNEFTHSLNAKIDTLAKDQKITDQVVVDQLKLELKNLYSILIEQSVDLKNSKTAKEHLQTIIELEMEDQSSLENIKLSTAVAKQFAQVTQASQAIGVQCADDQTGVTDSTQPAIPAPEDTATGANPIVNPTPNPISSNKVRMIAGSHNVIATAYQSCQAVEIPELSAATANVVGIAVVGKHSDGIGSLRSITNLSQVQNTHPYIKVAGGAQAGCFNVHNNPLIYDYGGEASVSNNTINFFKNSGSGSTSTLGVDCSAYVSSAIAAGGLRYKPGVDNKAIYIRQNSRKFINAQSSGFSCFSNPDMQPNSSLKPGDILGVKGHVVIIEKVGADPFGLKKLNSISSCSALPISQFDFTISQSSPSKNGVGINKFVARDYFKDYGSMQIAILGLGKAACQAYFNQKAVAAPKTDYGLIRHNGTAACMSNAIAFTNQSCVNQCLQ